MCLGCFGLCALERVGVFPHVLLFGVLLGFGSAEAKLVEHLFGAAFVDQQEGATTGAIFGDFRGMPTANAEG